MSTKLIDKIAIKGKIVLKTGLYIGGTNASLNIGGPDSFVIRNSLNNKPYIPGSSLKGKMRFLIELKYGECNNDGGATTDKRSKAGHLFGVADKNADNNQPSRIIVRDAELDVNSADFSQTDMLYTESKTEVTINRITAKANPRTIERVPAGAKFDFEMILNIFEEEKDQKQVLINTIKEAMSLLEHDYLGGNGSRGYGQVVFENVTFTSVF